MKKLVLVIFVVSVVGSLCSCNPFGNLSSGNIKTPPKLASDAFVTFLRKENSYEYPACKSENGECKDFAFRGIELKMEKADIANGYSGGWCVNAKYLHKRTDSATWKEASATLKVVKKGSVFSVEKSDSRCPREVGSQLRR